MYWKILGVNEENKLLLISTEEANPIEISGEITSVNMQPLSDKIYNIFYGNEELGTRAWAFTYSDGEKHANNLYYMFDNCSLDRLVDCACRLDGEEQWLVSCGYIDGGNFGIYDTLNELPVALGYRVIVELGVNVTPTRVNN